MNDPVKCPDCGLWWRTDTHKCEEKKAEVPAPVIKSTLNKNKGHNARAYCLSCHKSGTVYFEHECGNENKSYNRHQTRTWAEQYNYKIIKKDSNEHDIKKDGQFNKAKNSCKCGKDSK